MLSRLVIAAVLLATPSPALAAPLLAPAPGDAGRLFSPTAPRAPEELGGSCQDLDPPRQPGLFIKNARVIDGTGAPPQERMSILVRDGKIQMIGQGLVLRSTARMQTLDATGMTVLPGLIDSHVHFAAAPGGAIRGDSPETLRDLNQHHLRAYLASGVTTVLDPGAFPEVVRDIQAWLAAGNPGPRFLTTGPFLQPPGGYAHPDFGSQASPEDVERALDLIQSLGGVGVKLAVEEGFNPFASLPRFSPEVEKAIKDGAARRDLPLYIHATRERDQDQALDWGARAIMHGVQGGQWMGDWLPPDDLSDAFVAKMKASGAYQLTTFALVDTWPGLYAADRLDDRLLQLVTPPVELETARDAASADAYAINVIGFVVPWVPEGARPWLGRQLWSEENLREGLRYSQRNVKKLHDAGVPIVAATDAPSPWPEAIFNFHGPTTLREVELLGEAGLTPLEAIRAATATPAEMLRIDGEVGTVKVGKRADLLIVRGDPSKDLKALRDVAWTVRDGVARTPEQWMQSGGLMGGAAAPVP